MSKSNKSNLRNNLDSITNDVNNLLQKIDSPNEKLFNRKITNDIQLHGYVDPASLYRTNMNAEPSTKMKKDIDLLNQQNIRLGVPAGDIQYKVDNRQQLYPNSDINEYNNLRGAIIKNNDGPPFKNAAIRDTTLTYDTLLTEEEKAMLSKRAQSKKTQLNQQYDMQQLTTTNQPFSKDSRDSRYIFYPENEIAPANFQHHRSDKHSNPGDSKPLSNKNFDTEQQKSEVRQSTGDVFTHNDLSQRDRVPIDPKNTYRSSNYYESTPYNALDQEVTYDKRKELINKGELNYPTGTVFTHNAQRDRVPIDPRSVYRSADYASTPYNTLDIDVDHVPRVSQVNTTADYILNREFDINNDNRTSKDENAEVSMIHTPYTQLDKFDRADVRFKNSKRI